jgi:hypothetical protein
MLLRFLIIKVLFLWVLKVNSLSNFDHYFTSSLDLDQSENSFTNRISVRESNDELQVSTGDKIFVFGKAKGTLDKVKVGFDVLPFSQVADIEDNSNKFSKVSWKKLKDGSIQIISSYQLWPRSLIWTVYPNGQLKMEASGSSSDFKNAQWLGLGFDLPVQLLNQITWSDAGSGLIQWKNPNFFPMANPENESKIGNQGFFQPIQTIKLEFESITLDVSTETEGVYFSLGDGSDNERPIPNLKTDLAFFYNHPFVNAELIRQTPSGNRPERQVSVENPLVLWFLFQ